MSMKFKWIVWPLVLIGGAVILLRLLLAPTVNHAIANWFAEQGLDIEIEDTSFVLDDGLVAVSGLRATRDDEAVLKLGRLEVNWSWGPLFERRLELKSIRVTDLDFDVERGPVNKLIVAGIDLTPEDTTTDNSADAPPDWSLVLQDLQIENFKSCYLARPQHDYCNYFGKLGWRGRIEFDLAQSGNNDLPLALDGDFHLDQLLIHSNQLQRTLLRFEKLALRQLQVDTPNNLAIASIELEEVTALERNATGDEAQISQLGSLRLDDLSLTALSRLEIAAVNIREHDVLLVKQKEAGLETDEWLGGETKKTETVERQETQTSDFSFAIDKLNYQTDRSIRYRDDSLEQPFLAILNSIELQLENLDSQQPEQFSALKYSARYADHGIIELAGTATPLSPTPSFDIEGKIEGLDLRSLSAFTANRLGHRIKSGQLNALLSLKAKDGELESTMDLTLHKFNFEAISAADREKIDNSFGFPLNSSLSLLRDKDNRIQLQIPVSGNLMNPDFDFTDAVTKATSSAITTAVINYYTPFGLVTLVDGLFSLATALKFEPVVFPAGVAELTGADRGGLDKISRLMLERPGVHVTLCGFTNSADRELLLPQTAEIPVDELELEAEQMAQLETLGESRAAKVKNYLIEENVAAERLVLCAPTHVEGDGLAGIEISI